MERFKMIRMPLMALALLALLAGGWAGLERIGWHLPALQPDLASMHGPLMVAGVLGTVISLERAVALGRRWAYAAPLLQGLGGLVLIVGVPGWPGPLLLALGALMLVAIFAMFLRQQPALFIMIMLVGALTLLIGNVLWLGGWPIYTIVLWWVAFLVLTIAGERLELGRLRQLPARAERLFILCVTLLVSGLIVVMFAPDLGTRIVSFTSLGLACWLLRYDIARRTVRKIGLTRYIAVCLLSGYVWLGMSGIIGLVFGYVPAGPLYDAMLHTVFVGFVLAMIFGHAPVIIPAVLGAQVRFTRAFYGHLALLHASLLLRIAGDLTGMGLVRRWGGLLNAVTIVVFLGVMIWAVRAAKQRESCIHKPVSLSARR
ncbi:MAG TPA: hypothetical protein VFT66_08355 [Roseiflexaceae bacterium]|jgi:hypothetical protein|nr:hypothetical protein [Roseiflexaceae bacterium]